jgi:hypothetical protein
LQNPANLCGSGNSFVASPIQISQINMKMLRLVTLSQRLDAVDRVKEELQKELGLVDKVFFEHILQHYPQFIVTGAQSAGKSSAVRRFSGIRLPEKASRCTRTAVVLHLRRETASPTVVELKRLSEGTSTERIDLEDVTEAIQHAQDIAIEESSPSAEFAENHWVDVYVRHPDLPNITLVDLPGFTSDNDHDTQTVQRIVKRYLEMPGTLVLHVVKADQDYGAVLGNDFLRPYKDKCTSVFTYCDMLDSHPEENARTWMEKAIEETAYPRFAILGNCFGSLTEEAVGISGLRCFQTTLSNQYRLGTGELVQYLEQLITLHLDKQLPLTIQSLEQELAKVDKRLAAIKQRNPLGVILDIVKLVSDRVVEDEEERRNSLRAFLDELRIQIQNLPLRAIGSDSSRSRALENKEILEPGTRVMVDDNKWPSHRRYLAPVTSNKG